MSTSQKIMRAAAFLMVANLLSRILGLLRDSLLAGFFGKTGLTDAYNTAFALPDLIFWVLAGGMFGAAFIPVISDYIAKGQVEESWKVVSSVLNIIIILMCVLCALAMIFAPNYIAIQIPGSPSSVQELSTHLTRILLLQPLFMALSGLSMGILNAHKIFWPSALGTLLYNTLVIIVGTLLADPSNPRSIEGFAYGVVIGAIANFAIQIPHLYRVGFRYHPLIDLRHPAVYRIAALAFPILIFQALNQLQVITNTVLGSGLAEGSITAVQNAYRLHFAVVGIFAVAVGIAIMPTLTEQVALKQRRAFGQTFSDAVRTIIFISIPASVGMIVLRIPLIRALYEHGAFTAEDTQLVAIPLIYFALGITAQGLIMVVPRAFYAHKDTWHPVKIGITAMVVTVGLMIVLANVMGTGGLALATSLGACLQVALLFIFLRRKIGPLDGRHILASTGKTLFAAGIMGSIVYVWTAWIGPWAGDGKAGAVVLLLSGAALGFVIFIGIARALKMDEYNLVMDIARRNR